MTCEQCGECCRHYSGTGWAKTHDLLRWHDEGRYDILQYAVVIRGTTRVSCATLTRHALEQIPPLDTWTDPTGGTVLDTCPFLTPIAPDRWSCSIHRTKPEVCESCNPWEWGTLRGGFPCRAVQTPPQARRTSNQG